MRKSLYFVKHAPYTYIYFLRIVEYLKEVGNRKEVENCRSVDPELISSLEKCVGDESFKQWKKEVTAT